VEKMPEKLFVGILNVTLTGSILIAALLLLFPLLDRRFTAKWRYMIWLVLAIRLLVPFSLPSIPVHFFAPQITFTYPSAAGTALENMQSDDSSETQTTAFQAGPSGSSANTSVQAVPQTEPAQPSAPGKSVPLITLLIVVWLSGALLFIAYLFYGYILFRKSVSHWCRPVTQKRVVELWEEVRSEMEIHKNIPVMVCKKIRSPMMTGFIRPVVLLPHENYDNIALSAVLKHELMHCKRLDLWDKLLLKLVHAVHWFNPLVLMMVRTAENDIEVSCDEAVVRGRDMSYRLRYCEAILSAAQGERVRNTVFSTGFYGGKNSMKRRFGNILNISKKRKGTAALIVLVLAMVTSGTVLACQGANDNSAAQDQGSNINDVLISGKSVPFILKAENKDWARSKYVKAWDDPLYKEKFPDSSVRDEAAKHVLFEMPASASVSSYFFANIGFDDPDGLSDSFGPGDYLDYVGLLLLNARIQSVKILDDRVAILADPADTGYQVIWLDRDDLPKEDTEITLLTPDGKKVDSLQIQSGETGENQQAEAGIPAAGTGSNASEPTITGSTATGANGTEPKSPTKAKVNVVEVNSSGVPEKEGHFYRLFDQNGKPLSKIYYTYLYKVDDLQQNSGYQLDDNLYAGWVMNGVKDEDRWFEILSCDGKSEAHVLRKATTYVVCADGEGRYTVQSDLNTLDIFDRNGATINQIFTDPAEGRVVNYRFDNGKIRAIQAKGNHEYRFQDDDQIVYYSLDGEKLSVQSMSDQSGSDTN